jgi:anti-sigma factor RsiW
MFDFLKRRTQTEHDHCQEDLSAFLDGQLTRRERARVERHLQQCATCRADLEALRGTVVLLRTMPQLRPPRSFLLPASEAVRQRQVRREQLAYVALRAATAVATVLLVLVVSGDMLTRFPLVSAPLAPAAPEGRIMPTAQPPAEQGEAGKAPTQLMLEAASAEGTTEAFAGAEATAPPSEALPMAVSASPKIGAAAVDVGEATATAVPPVDSGGTTVPQTRPSRTFARPAAPPSVSTPLPPGMEVAEPSPWAKEGEEAETPEPLPTETAVPATPLPVPTDTPVPPIATPTATLTPMPTVAVQLVPSGEPVAPPPPAPAGWLVAIRPFLSRLEWGLSIVIACLAAVTLWLRRRQRET